MKHTVSWHDGIVEAKTHGDAVYDEVVAMITDILSHE